MYLRGRPSTLMIASVLVAATMSSVSVSIPTLPDANSLVVDRPQQTTQQPTPQNKVPAVPNSNFVPIYIPFISEDEKRFVSDGDEDSPTVTRSNFSDFLCIHSAPFEHAPVHKPP
jgi:hypothetical protein